MILSPSKRDQQLVAAKKAIARKKAPRISLDDMAALWGVKKSRFVTLKNEWPEFPEFVEKAGNAQLYDAKAALTVMIDRNQSDLKRLSRRSDKVTRILRRSSDADEEVEAPLEAKELLELSRASADIERQKVAQGELLEAAAVERLLGKIFSAVSSRLSGLVDIVDPNGRLPPATREAVREGGKAANLLIYEEIRDMLGDDVDESTDRTPPARKRTPRARKARVSRQSK